MLIGLTYDLRETYLSFGLDPEDVAELDQESTISALEEVISSLGHQVDRIGDARSLIQRISKGERWDLVFNISEGLGNRSRESYVPAILEVYGIPYTFGDPLTNALTLDKAMAKRILMAEGIPTPRFVLIENKKDLDDLRFDFPAFVKPNHEGTGKGIGKQSLVYNQEELYSAVNYVLKRFRQPALIEEYMPGREFTTGLLGPSSAPRCLGTMEIILREDSPSPYYSFEVKEFSERFAQYKPLIDEALVREIEDYATRAYKALGVRDAGRIDFRLSKGGRPMILEVNPLPGLHPTHSDLPMIARLRGMSYGDLISAIIESALHRIEIAKEI